MYDQYKPTLDILDWKDSAGYGLVLPFFLEIFVMNNCMNPIDCSICFNIPNMIHRHLGMIQIQHAQTHNS